MRIIYLLFLSVFLLACGSGTENEGGEEVGVQTIEDAVIYEAQKGAQTWILSTKEARFYENSNNAALTKPQLSFREGDNSLSSIRGDSGAIDLKNKQIILQGEVYGKSLSQNADLRTTLLNYDMEERKIWTDKNVTITRNGVTIKGRGLRANGDLSEIEIKQQTTTLPLDEKDI